MKISIGHGAIKKNIKTLAKEGIGHCKSKHHKPWLDEECTAVVGHKGST
jgi:hypothetical protein